MARKRGNNKYLIIIIVLLVLLVFSLIFLGIYIYKYINKPVYQLGDINVNNNSCNIVENNNDKYYIMDRKMLIEFNKYGTEELPKEERKVYIDYPVILGSHNSILNLNDEIKFRIDNYINNINLEGNVIDNSIEKTDLCYIKEYDDGVKKNYCNYLTLRYEVYENDKYVSILENKVFNSENTSGYTDLNDVYTIDKAEGLVISNDEVIKNIDNLSILKNSLIKFVRENYTSFSHYEVWEIKMVDFIADLDILLSTNNFKVFFDKDSIYFYFGKIQGVEEAVFKYKKNNWEELCDMYIY